MNTITVDYPVRFHAMMPEGAQKATLIVSVVLLAALFVYSLIQGRRFHTALPTLSILGGMLATFIEPICGAIGQSFHADLGQLTAFNTLDRPMPWHVVTTYGVYYGLLPVMFFRRIAERSVTPRLIIKIYVIFVVVAYASEVGPIHQGLWAYYGNQALWIWKGGPPLFTSLLYPIMALLPFALLYVLTPLLTGIRQLFIIPIIASGVGMGFIGVAWFWIAAANATWGWGWVQVAGVLSILNGWLLLWVFTYLIKLTSPQLRS